MAANKTQPNDQSVEDFIDSIAHQQRREDSRIVLEMMQRITQSKPKMWGGSIVGFGDTHYKYASGREGDWFLAGFSPRKQSLTIYLTCRFPGFEELLSKLGKYKTSVSCLYINKLSEVDLDILGEIIQKSVSMGAKL